MTKFSRREALSALAGISLAPVLARPGLAAGALDWTAWRGGEADFFRAPVLVTGGYEALLIDGGFNFPSGRALAEEIRRTGKRLTTIYVTVNDPDYYFGLTPVVEAFPDARVIAAPETIALIEEKAAGKLETWGPILGENGPQSRDDLVIPEPYDGDRLTVGGETLEIVTSRTMADRRYVWSPSLEAVFGGVYAFAGLHVWTADTATPESRAAWVGELDALIARDPKVVVAGHAVAGVDNGVAALRFTRDYLIAYEEEVARAADSAALIAAMTARYPTLGLEQALEIGAKVVTGEMDWGE